MKKKEAERLIRNVKDPEKINWDALVKSAKKIEFSEEYLKSLER